MHLCSKNSLAQVNLSVTVFHLPLTCRKVMDCLVQWQRKKLPGFNPCSASHSLTGKLYLQSKCSWERNNLPFAKKLLQVDLENLYVLNSKMFAVKQRNFQEEESSYPKAILTCHFNIVRTTGSNDTSWWKVSLPITGAGMRQSLKSLPTQVIPWFYNPILSGFCCCWGFVWGFLVLSAKEISEENPLHTFQHSTSIAHLSIKAYRVLLSLERLNSLPGLTLM